MTKHNRNKQFGDFWYYINCRRVGCDKKIILWRYDFIYDRRDDGGNVSMWLKTDVKRAGKVYWVHNFIGEVFHRS